MIIPSILALAIVAALCWWVFRIFRPAKGRPMACTACGHRGPTKAQTRGAILIEIVLWLLFIVPGLIYSLWRLSTRRQVCMACGNAALVPLDSPVGAAGVLPSAQTHVRCPDCREFVLKDARKCKHCGTTLVPQ